jgi:thioredoxin-dependent peroxiredoxin
MNTFMQAQDFTLPDQDNKIHSLKDYLGKWIVLYFYPKDDTEGCTKEACSFRDNFKKLQDLGVIILGASADTVKSHKKFAEKYSLNFPLLSDTEKKTINDYKAWGKKTMFGKEYEGILRTTYLINPEGEIEKVYEKVDPINHAEKILEDLKTLTT